MKHLRNPDLYHGKNKKTNFFEGWYFKLVDPANNSTLVIIPGINLGSASQKAHSFIQIYDANTGLYEFIEYPVEAFVADSNEFMFKIDKSTFSYDNIILDIKSELFDIKGHLSFNDHTRWPDSILSPGSMGYYNFIPIMECYSQVCALDFIINGSLEVNHKILNYEHGRGYIEKNWGSAFPLGWVWVQCNHFSEKPVSLSASIGHIPFITGSFRGFLIGLWVKDTFYEFTTMNKSRLQITKQPNCMQIHVTNKNHSLSITVDTSSARFITLKGPKDGKMIPMVEETIQGVVDIELIEKSDNRTVFSGLGLYAGVEYGGEQMLMLK